VAEIIQIRRDTSANWTSVNPVLALGEQGFETDSLRYKTGDGVTVWTGIAYSKLNETYLVIPALDIDVSNANVQGKSISADSTFTFSGWTTDASSVDFYLTVTGTPVVSFTGVTFKVAPVLSAGINVLVFTSVDGGTTINGFIARDFS